MAKSSDLSADSRKVDVVFARQIRQFGLIFVAGLALCGASLASSTKATLLPEGVEGLSAKVQVMREAVETLDFSTYVWAPDEAGLTQLELLRQAALRGVRVRVVVDAEGCKIPLAMLRMLENAGAQVRVYRPLQAKNFRYFTRRMHDKFVSADRKRIVVGSRNGQNPYYQIGDVHNDDVDCFLEGADAEKGVDDFSELFNGTAVKPLPKSKRISKARMELARKKLEYYTDAKIDEIAQMSKNAHVLEKGMHIDGFRIVSGPRDSSLKPVIHHQSLGSLLGDPSEGTPTATKEILGLMGRTRKELTVISPYMLLTPELKAEIAGLRHAGKQVRLVTNSIHSARMYNNIATAAASRNDFEWLKSIGVDIREYKGPNMLHAKVYSRDGAAEVFFGSANVDPRSQLLNSEVGAIVRADSSASAEWRSAVNAYTDSIAGNATIPQAKLVACGKREVLGIMFQRITRLSPIKNSL